MKAECRMEEAKELTQELLGRHISSREEALVVNEHCKRKDFDWRQRKMLARITILEKLLAPQQQV